MALVPEPVDLHVGDRIRLRRKALGLSQEHLAAAVGVSYQQVQKYERGHNRVSASSLFEISCSLDVGVSYFFDGLARGLGDANEAANPPALMASHEGRELAALFPMVTSAAVRRQIVDFVRVISQERP